MKRWDILPPLLSSTLFDFIMRGFRSKTGPSISGHSLSALYSRRRGFASKSYSPSPFYTGLQFLKIGNDPLRLRTSWGRAPTDAVQPGHPFNFPAPATSAAASRAWGNRDGSGADGCGHGCFDNSVHPHLGTHHPTVNQRNVVEPNIRQKFQQCRTID